MPLMAALCLALKEQLPLKFWGPSSTYPSNLSGVKLKHLLLEKPESPQISYSQQEHPKGHLWHSLQLILVLEGLVICRWEHGSSCKEPQCVRIKRLDSSLSPKPAGLWDVISPLSLLSWWFSTDLPLALFSGLLWSLGADLCGAFLTLWLLVRFGKKELPVDQRVQGKRLGYWSYNFPSLNLSLSPPPSFPQGQWFASGCVSLWLLLPLGDLRPHLLLPGSGNSSLLPLKLSS